MHKIATINNNLLLFNELKFSLYILLMKVEFNYYKKTAIKIGNKQLILFQLYIKSNMRLAFGLRNLLKNLSTSHRFYGR